MKYIKYGSMAFSRFLGMCILIIIQLATVTIALNISIGSFNSRNMLYAPYKDILSKEGYFIIFDMVEGEETIDGEPVMIHGGDVFKERFEKLKGDVDYAEICTLNDTLVSCKTDPPKITVVDDRIYDKLCMPLSKGNYSSAVITLNSRLAPGDVIKIGSTEVKISGMLTDNTYIPTMNEYDIDMDCRSFYEKYKSDDVQFDQQMAAMGEAKTERTPVLLVPLSALKNESNIIYGNDFKLLFYNTPPTEEIREYNDRILNEMPNSSITLEELNRRSGIYARENIVKTLPIIICLGTIAMFGILCCTCIMIARSTKANAVYYISGATLGDCITINAFTILIIEAICAALTTAVLATVRLTGMDTKLGMVVFKNNWLVTVGVFGAMFVISAIVSAVTFKSRDPKQLLAQQGL